MDAFLIVQRGEDIGRRFDIDTTQLTIGRGSDNDLVLNDPMVSRYHAVVKRQGNRFTLIDLGSSNPVVVNDQALEPGMGQQLTHRDVVFIGKTVFSFQNRAAGAGPAPGRPTPQVVTPPRPEAAETQFMGSRDFDPPTPPPATRATPQPSSSAMGEKTVVAPIQEAASGGDNDKTMIIGGSPPAATPPPALFSPPPAPPAPIKFDDDDETRTSVGFPGAIPPPPPPPIFGAPPPPGDRLIGTPPNEEDGDLPTQIIPRR